jgi:hypothetical protein
MRKIFRLKQISFIVFTWLIGFKSTVSKKIKIQDQPTNKVGYSLSTFFLFSTMLNEILTFTGCRFNF